MGVDDLVGSWSGYGRAIRQGVRNFPEALHQVPRMEVGVGYGWHVREARFGPIKAGIGYTIAAGGIGVHADESYVWGLTWDLSVDVSITFTPVSFAFELDFQPLYDFFSGRDSER